MERHTEINLLSLEKNESHKTTNDKSKHHIIPQAKGSCVNIDYQLRSDKRYKMTINLDVEDTKWSFYYGTDKNELFNGVNEIEFDENAGPIGVVCDEDSGRTVLNDILIITVDSDHTEVITHNIIDKETKRIRDDKKPCTKR